jgi:hypothetical protein
VVFAACVGYDGVDIRGYDRSDGGWPVPIQFVTGSPRQLYFQRGKRTQDETKARARLASLDLAYPKATNADPGSQFSLIEPERTPSVLDQGADSRGRLDGNIVHVSFRMLSAL